MTPATVATVRMKLPIGDGKNLVEIGARGFDLGEVQVIDDDGERELAEVVAIHFEFFERLAEFADLRFFGAR
jgi:hypothetical protein